MKAIEQYLHVVLFIMLYKVVQTFVSVDEILVWPIKWKQLSSSSCGTVFIMLYNVVLTFESVDEILVRPFKWMLLNSTFLWCWL